MKQHLPLGIVCALLATIFYSSLTAINKVYAVTLPLPVLIFIQSAVALILFSLLIARKGLTHARQTLATQRIFMHLLRGFLSLSASYLIFSSVLFIPLTNTMLLANTTPILIPFLAALFLKQKIKHRLWVPILIGFVGIGLVLRPDGSIINPASFLALAAAVFIGCGMLTVRRLAVTDSSEAITFYFFFFSTIIAGLIAIKFWTPLPSSLWMILIISGILYFASQYIMTFALKFANAQLVSSLLYMNVINAVVISAIFWDTVPTGLTVSGILLTVLGGILCIRVEHNHAKLLKKTGLQYVEES